jgi:hypothetical protein
LGLMAYPDPKGERDNRMPANRRSRPGVRLDALWDPRDMAKATLPKPQSPEDARHRPPERHPRLAPRPATTSLFCRRNLRSVERCPVRAIKEMSGAPKSRSDVQQRRTRDQPTGREPHGDGVPIVVVRFTPHQGGRESRPQGEGAQATGYRRPGGMRNAERRNGIRCPTASNRGMVAGEPGELKGSRRVWEGGVGKGPTRGTSPAPYLSRRSGPGVRGDASRDPRDMRKLDCLNPNLHKTQRSVRRKDTRNEDARL